MKLLITTLATICASSAFAQEPTFYGEVGFSHVDLRATDFNATPKQLRATVGADVHPNLSVEGSVSGTIFDGKYKFSNATDIATGQNVVGSYERNLKASTYGIFLKPKYAVSKDTEIFARVGYAHTKLNVGSISGKTNTGDSVTGGEASASSSGAAYGFGIQTLFTANVTGQMDYMRYKDVSGISVKGLTATVGYRF